MVGTLNVESSAPANGAPERMPTAPEVCGKLLPVYTFIPVMTLILSLMSASGVNVGDGSQDAPVLVGTHLSGNIPLPQKKIPKRLGNASPAAYALPWLSRNTSSAGSPMLTAAPPIMPRSIVLRESLVLFMVVVP